jgi:hypothetical protein
VATGFDATPRPALVAVSTDEMATGSTEPAPDAGGEGAAEAPVTPDELEVPGFLRSLE